MKIGRNEKCPCGSGKKFKHCCLEKDEFAVSPPAEPLVYTNLHQALAERTFTSSEDAEQFMRAFTQTQDDLPIADFAGLSSQQMHTILHSSLSEMSAIVSLNDNLTDAEALASPLVAGIRSLLRFMASQSGEITLTKSYELPRKAVAACIQSCNPSWRRGAPVPMEHNSPSIMLVRNIALNLGYISEKGNLTYMLPEGIHVHQKQPWASVYRRAMEHLIDEYDWLDFLAESHQADHFHLIADSAVFGLYLLHQYPEDTIDAYLSRFRQAFPAFYQPANADPAAKKLLDVVVEDLFFISFAQNCGLIEYADSKGLNYRTTDLFHSSFLWTDPVK